jgi:hypothetical protein
VNGPVLPFVSLRSYVPGYTEGEPLPRMSTQEFIGNVDAVTNVYDEVGGIVLWDAASHDDNHLTLDAWWADMIQVAADALEPIA